MGNGTFILYDVDLESVRFLAKEEVAELFIALTEYRLADTIPDFGDNRTLKVLFHQITKHISINEKKYEELCKRNSEIAKKRWQNSKNTNAYESITSDTNVCLYDTETDTETDTVTDNDTVACGAQKKIKENKSFGFNNHNNYSKYKNSNIPRLLQDEPNYDAKAFEQKALNLKYEKNEKER